MKRELLSYFAVLGGMAAATLFLCARPDVAPHAALATPAAIRAAADTHTGTRTDTHTETRTETQAGTRADAVPPAAELAVEAGDLGSRADRHASDALRVAQQPVREDDLDWDYVQLRL
ncbi:hypothetical protein [Cupriavidus sp. WS]|uniref:hypothetical protein n=1 Tax=Cupriavidus sp. WS TaxID=1312922 RepID=UPI00038233F5|nr:hypothetical protein [Cupriavidus sp. WS]